MGHKYENWKDAINVVHFHEILQLFFPKFIKGWWIYT
jgi:hypothetical protein